jgi:hypothetical protein
VEHERRIEGGADTGAIGVASRAENLPRVHARLRQRAHSALRVRRRAQTQRGRRRTTESHARESGPSDRASMRDEDSARAENVI